MKLYCQPCLKRESPSKGAIGTCAGCGRTGVLRWPEKVGPIRPNNAIDMLAAKLTTRIAKALKLTNEQSVIVYDILRAGLR